MERIPEEHFILAEEIIAYAEGQLGTKLNDHIYLALSDHISYAISREVEGIRIRNKLLHEIKVLYPSEFSIGVWAIGYIKEKIAVVLPIDEAAFIALHIHTMKIKGGDLRTTVRQTSILKDMVETIQDYLDITINEDHLSYERLVTNLRFALTRAEQENTNTMDEEMLFMIKKKFVDSYQCAVKVRAELAAVHDIHLPEEELGYIALHIERIKKLR